MNLEPVLQRTAEKDSLVSAIRLLDTAEGDLSEEHVRLFVFRDEKQIRHQIYALPEIKQSLHAFLKDVRHGSVLDAVLELLGIGSVQFLISPGGRKLPFELSLGEAQRPFVVTHFEVCPRMLSAVAYLLYTGEPPEVLPCFSDRKEIARAMLAAVGDYPSLFRPSIVRHYSRLVQEELMTPDAGFGKDDVIGNARRFHGLGLLRHIAGIVAPGEWIWSLVPDTADQPPELNELVIRARACADDSGWIDPALVAGLFA
jgi:hypothetical protein